MDHSSLRLLIDQENGAAFGFDFRSRDLQDQLQQLSQIERGVEQARGFKEQ